MGDNTSIGFNRLTISFVQSNSHACNIPDFFFLLIAEKTTTKKHPYKNSLYKNYPLVICYIAIENGPFSSWIYPLKLVDLSSSLCTRLPEGKPPFSYGMFLWFSCGFPMVFLWFSYGFPVVILCFSYGFPMVFLWFSYGFLNK